MASADGSRCREDTSNLSDDLAVEEASSSEESSTEDAESSGGDDSPPSVTKSCVLLEIPEHACTTGIRKIRFSFSKRKECVESEKDQETEGSMTTGSIGGEPYANSYGRYPLMSEPYLSAPNMELKMSKKVVPDAYPTNVRKLLSTGILNGARVKYVFNDPQFQRTLDGIISGGGYICGCSSCNFTEVVSAYEFEQHACYKTRHPNNHIYLENGKPIYSIIQELKTAPLCLLDEVIRDVAGSSINENFFHIWKGNLHQSGERSKVAKKQLKSLLHSHMSYLEESRTPSSHSPVWANYVEMQEKQKRPVKKLGSKSSKQQKKSAESGKRRDNDLHKLLFMPNGLPDGAELVYLVKGEVCSLSRK